MCAVCALQADSRVSAVAADSGEREASSGHAGLDSQRQWTADARLPAPEVCRREVSGRTQCLFAGPAQREDRQTQNHHTGHRLVSGPGEFGRVFSSKNIALEYTMIYRSTVGVISFP